MAAERFPVYRFPARLLATLAIATIDGHQRSFREDAIHLLSGLKPPLHVETPARLPQGCPVVVTVNHYSRKGFSAIWVAAAVSACVPAEVYWTTTTALMSSGKVSEALSRVLLRRMAKVYGFNLMPPMPPQPNETRQRSQAVRQMVEHVRSHPHALLGFAPEGMDITGGVLGWPPAGVGRLLAQLSGMGVQFLPCAIHEDAGRLIIGFGECYQLDVPEGMPKDELDRQVSQKAMGTIAKLLPEYMRAEFTTRE